MSSATWKTILSTGLKEKRGGGQEDGNERTAHDQYPAGIPLTSEEIKASRAFRPVNTAGQSLCWDFSSHAGCKAPAGQCSRGAHEMLKLAGLHRLIKMHLSRRGGHRSEKKISVKDIDGHVQNLRANLTQEDLRYKDTNKGKYRWAPKAAGAVHRPHGAPEELCQPSIAPTMKTAHTKAPAQQTMEETTWRTSVLPTDFDSFDFTPLEDDTRLLVHLSDEWVRRPLSCSQVELLSSTLEPDQKTIDKWWEEKAPHMHPAVTPFVKNHLRAAATADMGDLSDEQLRRACISGFHLLIKDGCKADEQCARAALVLADPLSACTAGKEHLAVRWGEKIQRIDYSAQTVRFGNLHYTAVDFGDVVMLANSTQKALRTPNREETDQCVLLHLAASGGWKGQGCPKRSPHKSRVDAFATHLRQYEYQQASAFVTKVKQPRTQREYTNSGLLPTMP